MYMNMNMILIILLLVFLLFFNKENFISNLSSNNTYFMDNNKIRVIV